MIDSISIKQFRCYKDCSIKGFKRINLIGGLNNAGKTILLEAILLNSSPTFRHITLLRGLRGEDMNTKELPEYTWDNFFYNLERDKSIFIETKHSNKNIIGLEISNNEIVDDFRAREDEEDENNMSIYEDLITNEKNYKSVLHLKQKIDNKEIPILVAISHDKGISTRKLNTPSYKTANFIPASSKRKQSILARDYGVAEKRNKANLVLKALQIIDKDIEEVKVSVVGGIHLEMKKVNKDYMSVTLFGDAINKMLNIVLTLINNNSSIILVDEIENGIHHTAQSEFWKFIINLSLDKELDFQLFATTHSYEMLKSFGNVSSEIKKADCAYFELYKNYDTDDISYNLHDMNTLNYEISNNMSIRGE